jgi:hypothetical protein
VFGLFNAVSAALGRGRTLIRRLGGIALLLMGVHAAADVLDNLAYTLLDALDLIADDAVGAALAWLSSVGGIAPDAAVEASERFATVVDLGEKEWLSLRLAFATELLLDVLLLDLAWGTRIFDGTSRLDDLKRSAQQMREALSSFDLERVLGPVTLLAFSVGGAVLAAMALEQPASAALVSLLPGLTIASNIGAAAAILVVALLVWRFVPEQLHGALVRSLLRAERFRERQQQRRSKHPPRWPRVAVVVDTVRAVVRGTWLLLALAVAGMGLVADVDGGGRGAVGLIERVGAVP